MRIRLAAAVITLAMLISTEAISSAQSPLQWQMSLENAKRLAAASNQLVLIHFWAPFCGACRRMDDDVFPDPRVVAVVQSQYVPVKLNSEQFPSTATQFDVTKLPTDVIITPSGQVVKKSEGYLKAPQYAEMLALVASNNRPRGATPAVPVSIPAAQSPNGNFAMPPAVAAPPNRQATAASYASGNAGGTPMNMGPAAASGGPNPYAPPAAISQPMPPIAAAQQQQVAPGAGAAAAVANAVPSFANYGATLPLGGGNAQAAGISSVSSQGATPDGNGNISAAAAKKAPDVPAPAASGAAPATPSGSPNPPLALDGYCPVELQERHAWMLGDKRWGVLHLGKLYLFAGPDQWQRFFANPEKYAPVLSGMDIVAAVDRQQFVPGDRRFGGYFDSRLYLFSNEENLQRFDREPQRYATAAKQQFKATPTNQVR